MSKQDYVTASEIGEYTFCPRGWWLHYNGLQVTTPQMELGTHVHETMGKKVRWFHRAWAFASVLIIICLIILICLFGLSYLLF